MKRSLLAVIFLTTAALLPAAKNLEVYFVDVEGGQATLFVSPSGESMLIDTGWGGFNRRDAERIGAAAKSAGVKRIDYLVITHYHADHVGGVMQLAEKLPIRNFVDHGASVETSKNAETMYLAYADARKKGNHLQVKPGDKVPVKDLDVQVLSAGGSLISAPVAGAGKPNAECASLQKKPDDATENGQSVGVLVKYGDFQLLDLGDLTWNKEAELVCPVNKIGTVDVYVTSHHGTPASGVPQLIHAITPRAAIMNNGARKGGAPAFWQTVHDTPGVQDLWQVHFSIEGGKEHNSADNFIANVDEKCEGKGLKLSAQKDGTFTIYNSRNKYEKTYKK